MKKLSLIGVFSFILSTAFAQFTQDSIIVYKAGIKVVKYDVPSIDTITFKSTSGKDSIFFYKNSLVTYKEDVSKIDSIYKQSRFGKVKDIDGNTYKTIQMGKQIWMAENLDVSKYNDGTVIPQNVQWVDSDYPYDVLTQPNVCWYKNDRPTYEKAYGALYSFGTINTSKLCMAGWHVPSKAEWDTLFSFVGGPNTTGPYSGGSTQAGKFMKLPSPLWKSLNGGTNESGFSAIPSGYRDPSFRNDSIWGIWWTTQIGDQEGLSDVIYVTGFFTPGYSVRCVKNQLIPAIISNYNSNSFTEGTTGTQLNATTNSTGTIVYSLLQGDQSGVATVSTSGYVTILKPGKIIIQAQVLPNAQYSGAIKYVELTINPASVMDMDGNVYTTKLVNGNKVVFTSNLRVTRFNDGMPIPTYYNSSSPGPSMSWYNNDAANKFTYGGLYNGYAVSTAKLCPVNYHVTNSNDISAMTLAYNGTSTNLTTLGGYSLFANLYMDKDIKGYWWKSDVANTTNTTLGYTSTGAFDSNNSQQKGSALSVTCVRNYEPGWGNFGDLNKKNNDAPFQLAAMTTGDGAITYSIVSGTAATVTSTGMLTISGVGTVQIKATAAETGSYKSTTQTITLTITAAAN